MIKQRYNVLYKLITILTFSCHHLYYYIMSLVQASVSASAFFLACLERVVNFLLMKVLFRQLLSDVRKMIWTIHRWYLFKLLPVESPEDSQFIGNVILWYDVADELQQLEYDHKWASVHDECLYATLLISSNSWPWNRLSTVCTTLVAFFERFISLYLHFSV